MLQLKNVSKSFGDVQAVANLSLAIQEREIFVLLGPTGAGKTTTLKIAAGLIIYIFVKASSLHKKSHQRKGCNRNSARLPGYLIRI